ncbi:hypothetical protein IG631_00072 [Alternaria alternata]|nr:hypothetical protein IG631_00072 [Alternaria alternata]
MLLDRKSLEFRHLNRSLEHSVDRSNEDYICISRIRLSFLLYIQRCLHSYTSISEHLLYSFQRQTFSNTDTSKSTMRLVSNILLLLAVALPTLANDFDECKVGARSCYGAAPQECKRENFIAPALWVFAEECSGDGACSEADGKCHWSNK